MIKHLDITIFGKVQEVNFRSNAKQVADILGISGLIKNEPNGSVYAEAEAEEKDLQAFVHWCKEGPTHAEVNKVEAKEGQIKNYSGFAILR
jgi:acylphosphatase